MSVFRHWPGWLAVLVCLTIGWFVGWLSGTGRLDDLMSDGRDAWGLWQCATFGHQMDGHQMRGGGQPDRVRTFAVCTRCGVWRSIA